MNQQEIMRLLPHRDNMLLVDQAEVCPQEGEEQRPTPLQGKLHRHRRRMVFEGTFSRKSGGARGGAVQNDGTEPAAFCWRRTKQEKRLPLFSPALTM